LSWPEPLPPDETPWREPVPERLIPGHHPLPRVTLRSAWLNLLLFLLTAVSVFQTHGLLWQELPGGGGVVVIDWLAGAQVVVSLLAILLAHEFGHYFAARRHGVDASLPYFIPFPLSPAGTLGAFIRIRGLIPHREALFDIGAAGKIAAHDVACRRHRDR
jgi:Zn-dependent protease